MFPSNKEESCDVSSINRAWTAAFGATYVNDGGPRGAQQAAQRRPAGQHAAKQVGVQHGHHVVRFGPQQQSVPENTNKQTNNSEHDNALLKLNATSIPERRGEEALTC